ncbi:MAG: TonB family protein [Bacteroidetes bacterium]|nr:TonB family protein [Bacteroidota bacterium]
MKTVGNDWDNPISPERLALVFQDRNQAYGAYTLRRDYNRTVTKAVFLSFAGLLLLVFTPSIIHYLSPEKILIPTDNIEVIVDITDVTLPDKIIPIPEKVIPTPPTPQRSSTQFTNLIVKDVDSTDNELTQDDLSKLLLATRSVDVDSVPGKDPLPDTKDNSTTGTSNPYIWVEEMPQFPGGVNEMLKYLKNNIKYPIDAREANITGVVYLSFIVDKEGEIKNIEILKGIGGGCEEEAVRVVKKMSKWNPGKQNGKAVNVQFKLPVSFTLR